MVTTHFDLVSGPFWGPGGPKKTRFGPERPFWGPPRSSEGPDGPHLVPTALEWSHGVKHMVTTHFDLVSGPLRVPRDPKRAILAQSLNFHDPNFFGNSFCSKYRLVGCPDRRSGMPGSSSTLIAHMEPPSLRKQAKRVRLGSERPLLGPRRSWEGPEGADLVPTAPDRPGWVEFMVTTHFDLVSGPFWGPGGPKRAHFGPERPFWGPLKSSEGPGRPHLVPTAPE